MKEVGETGRGPSVNRRTRVREGAVCVIFVFAVIACSAPRPRTETPKPESPGGKSSGSNCVVGRGGSPELIQWRANGAKAIVERLAAVEACFDTVTTAEHVGVTVAHSSPEERTTLITGTTLADCTVTRCVAGALDGLTLGAPPEVLAPKDLNLQEALSFDPGRMPRLRATLTPDVPLPVEGACVEKEMAPVSGHLDREHVGSVLMSASPEITRCFSAGLAGDRWLSGTLRMRVLVGPDGAVEKQAVGDNSIADCAIVGCVRDVISRLRFKPPDGGATEILLPVGFTQQWSGQ